MDNLLNKYLNINESEGRYEGWFEDDDYRNIVDALEKIEKKTGLFFDYDTKKTTNGVKVSYYFTGDRSKFPILKKMIKDITL